ncbi:hypothetical protein ACFX15_027355 [Malus domestica]
MTELSKTQVVEMGEIRCDLYAGTWVKDEHYPFYEPRSCPYVDEAFDCQSNGMSDSEYLKWRWKPQGCDLPSDQTSHIEVLEEDDDESDVDMLSISSDDDDSTTKDQQHARFRGGKAASAATAICGS